MFWFVLVYAILALVSYASYLMKLLKMQKISLATSKAKYGIEKSINIKFNLWKLWLVLACVFWPLLILISLIVIGYNFAHVKLSVYKENKRFYKKEKTDVARIELKKAREALLIKMRENPEIAELDAKVKRLTASVNDDEE